MVPVARADGGGLPRIHPPRHPRAPAAPIRHHRDEVLGAFAYGRAFGGYTVNWVLQPAFLAIRTVPLVSAERRLALSVLQLQHPPPESSVDDEAMKKVVSHQGGDGQNLRYHCKHLFT